MGWNFYSVVWSVPKGTSRGVYNHYIETYGDASRLSPSATWEEVHEFILDNDYDWFFNMEEDDGSSGRLFYNHHVLEGSWSLTLYEDSSFVDRALHEVRCRCVDERLAFHWLPRDIFGHLLTFLSKDDQKRLSCVNSGFRHTMRRHLFHNVAHLYLTKIEDWRARKNSLNSLAYLMYLYHVLFPGRLMCASRFAADKHIRGDIMRENQHSVSLWCITPDCIPRLVAFLLEADFDTLVEKTCIDVEAVLDDAALLKGIAYVVPKFVFLLQSALIMKLDVLVLSTCC